MWRDGYRVLGAEWLRLRRSRATIVGLIAYVIVLGIIHLGYVISTEQSLIGIESGFFISGAVLSGAVTPLAFMAVLFISFAMAREFSHGTIVLAWTRPLSRSGWLSGKLLTGFIVTSILYALTLIIVIAAAGFQFGFQQLAEKSYVIHTEPQLWWHLVLTAALTLLGLWAVISVAAIPSLLINSPGGALATILVLGFVMEIGTGWSFLQPLLPVSYVSQPFDQFVAMAKGISLPYAWSSLVQTCVIGSFAWSIIGFAGSRWIARRKEILG